MDSNQRELLISMNIKTFPDTAIIVRSRVRADPICTQPRRLVGSRGQTGAIRTRKILVRKRLHASFDIVAGLELKCLSSLDGDVFPGV